jgi:hypothetical protein
MLEYFEVFERIYSEQTLREITLFFKYSINILKIDPHFDVLKNIEFPKVEIMTPEEFIKKYF